MRRLPSPCPRAPAAPGPQDSSTRALPGPGGAWLEPQAPAVRASSHLLAGRFSLCSLWSEPLALGRHGPQTSSLPREKPLSFLCFSGSAAAAPPSGVPSLVCSSARSARPHAAIRGTTDNCQCPRSCGENKLESQVQALLASLAGHMRGRSLWGD